ncbi:PAS domain-containing protein [Sorangium sp. So ce448]|uniref:PAS domain-containing protein n=1 Tax=Sorangium sp. So ce448 TaxID=3133314 RepID=UPI003F5F2DE3
MADPESPVDSLQAFFSSCPDMLFVAELDGRLRRTSDALERALGPVAARGATLASLVDDEADASSFEAAWGRLRASGDPVQLAVCFRDAHGGRRTLACSATRSPSGDAVYGSLRGVLTRTPEASPRSNLKARVLDHLAEHVSIGIWTTDREGVLLFSEGKGLRQCNIEPNQFVGMSVFELYKGYPITDSVRRSLVGEQTHSYEEVHGYHWESWVVPFRGDAGEIEGVLGISLNVTEAKNAEAELRSQLQQIENQRQVIRTLSMPIIEVWSGVLTLPMVGIMDSVRTADIMESLLGRIVEKQARFAILDLTGVEMVDTQVASHLIELVTAIRLLGAEGIVAGIKPNVAQTMVALGLDLSQITTQQNLRAALGHCIRKMSAERQLAPARADAAAGGAPSR